MKQELAHDVLFGLQHLFDEVVEAVDHFLLLHNIRLEYEHQLNPFVRLQELADLINGRFRVFDSHRHFK